MFVLALVGFIFYFFTFGNYRYIGFVLAFLGYIFLYSKLSDKEFWRVYFYSLIIYAVFFLLFFYLNGFL